MRVATQRVSTKEWNIERHHKGILNVSNKIHKRIIERFKRVCESV